MGSRQIGQLGIADDSALKFGLTNILKLPLNVSFPFRCTDDIQRDLSKRAERTLRLSKFGLVYKYLSLAILKCINGVLKSNEK